MNPVTFTLVSLGCAKNTVDSENILGLLKEKGFVFTPDPKGARVIIVNTCSFIESAQEESVQELITMVAYKRQGACQVLVAVGCLPAKFKTSLFKEIPELDALVTPGNISKIAAIISQCLDGAKIACLRAAGPPVEMPRQVSNVIHSIYVKIADGCNHSCAFCIIPKLRGKYRSRSLESIVAEVEGLTASGAREVVLVAQDTTYYGLDLYGKKKLPELLKRLSAIPGVMWIRILYTHPLHIDGELLTVIRKEEKVCSYLDIPLQHICDSVLQRMNRGSVDIRRLLDQCRNQVQDMVLRSTFIVGFPGETRSNFNELLSFFKEYKIDSVGIFKFSPEAGTMAASLGNQVPERVKEDRYHQAMSLLRDLSIVNQKKQRGKVMDVLVDEIGGQEGIGSGRYYGQAPEVDGKVFLRGVGPIRPGDMVQARIVSAREYDLVGEIR